jgi:hypothetical protein
MHLIQHLKQEPIARKTMILIATIILGIAVRTDATAAGHVGGGGGFGGGHIGGGLGGGHFGGGFGDGFHDGHHRFGEARVAPARATRFISMSAFSLSGTKFSISADTTASRLAVSKDMAWASPTWNSARRS